MIKHMKMLRAVAIVGVVLVWLPFLAMLVTSTAGLFSGFLRVDYLMPAELALAVFAGGLLLLVVALLVKRRCWLIGGLLAGAALLLAGTQGAAEITGLAHGPTEPAGWPLVLVLSILGLYILCVVALGIGGILLLRSLAVERTYTDSRARL